MSENKVFCSDPEDFDIIAEASSIIMLAIFTLIFIQTYSASEYLLK
ncbi:MAG: hypothetical protein K6G87_09885 [Butyrivibrio sp.]|nr:hypothetical protein [Butyrivibrio sp.]MCR5771523.1 hypothetical protein [Butyrivibrio sp.]